MMIRDAGTLGTSLFATVLALGISTARADHASCNALSAKGLFADTVVRSTTEFAPGGSARLL
jgi:hypothetical protein